MENLGRFEGREVVATGVEITNAGDGLSKAMAVDPEKCVLGERRFIVIEAVCTRVKFEPVKDAPNHRQRIHVFKAAAATFIDDELVSDAIEKQKIRIEESVGISRLPGVGEPAED